MHVRRRTGHTPPLDERSRVGLLAGLRIGDWECKPEVTVFRRGIPARSGGPGCVRVQAEAGAD